MPGKRFSLTEIRNSLWLSDVMITENIYDKWCIVPTVGSPNNINEIELRARKQLLSYGIDSKMLEEHAAQGIQSDIIATYRIIIHKILSSIGLPAVTKITGKKLDHARSHVCKIM